VADVPIDDATYSVYATARGPIALAQSSLLPLNLVTPDPQGRSFGLHPNMPELQALFNNDRKLAFMANVGTLVEPTTAAKYLNGTAKLPPQLFSHADQQVEWQNSVSDRPSETGWGGRLADLLNSFNSNNEISMSITLNGQNSFQVGRTVSQYAVGTGGEGFGLLRGFHPEAHRDGQPGRLLDTCNVRMNRDHVGLRRSRDAGNGNIVKET